LPCFGLLCPGVCFASAEEEFYLDLLPWQWLAASNQNFLITERRRHYLRYAGALTFFEINGPSVYKVGSQGRALCAVSMQHFLQLRGSHAVLCGCTQHRFPSYTAAESGKNSRRCLEAT
jgi:hypothetical protein